MRGQTVLPSCLCTCSNITFIPFSGTVRHIEIWSIYLPRFLECGLIAINSWERKSFLKQIKTIRHETPCTMQYALQYPVRVPIRLHSWIFMREFTTVFHDLICNFASFECVLYLCTLVWFQAEIYWIKLLIENIWSILFEKLLWNIAKWDW